MVSAGSGTVDVKELKIVMEAVGQHCSDAELSAMLNEVQSQHVRSSRLNLRCMPLSLALASDARLPACASQLSSAACRARPGGLTASASSLGQQQLETPSKQCAAG